MTNFRHDVLGIGNAIVDVLARVDDDFLAQRALAKGSMQLVDDDQASALYDELGPAIEISGGSGANSIAGIASFGGTPAYFGKVRNDQMGGVFAHDIRSAGVAFDTAPATTGAASGRCLVLITPDGERTMNTCLGASTSLSPGDIDEDVVAASQVTYLEGYLWDPEQAKQAFLKAARCARKAGRKVALSLSDAFCVERHRDSFRQLIRDDVDILFANEDEIKSLYQVDLFDEALQAARADCALAALTRSAAGSIVIAGDEVHVADAVKVDQVNDTTGAGDLYAAGFLYGLTHHMDPAASARLGALAASEVITHIGARPRTSLRDMATQAGYLEP